MAKTSPMERRRKELVKLIEDALVDMQVKRIFTTEFQKSTLKMIGKLKKLEKGMKVDKPEWKRLASAFEKIKEGLKSAKTVGATRKSKMQKKAQKIAKGEPDSKMYR